MNIAQGGAGTLPSHVDPARVLDFDMFGLKAVDGEYQKAIYPYTRPGSPEIFWTQSNGGHWVLVKADDIEFAMTNPTIFSASKMFVPREKNPNPPLTPLMIDPPDHAKYKAMMAPAFAPRSVQKLGEGAREIAIELIEGFRARGKCEFIHEFAESLPIDVFMNMVELPKSDKPMLMEIGEQHVRPLTPQHHIDSMMQLQAYALQKVNERRANPGDDLISHLTRCQLDGKPLDDHALVGMVVLLLVAGLDTVAAAMGFFARFLATEVEHRGQLIADPGLIPKAVEELMRRYAIATAGRILVQDHDFKGVSMKAGDMVIMPTVAVSFDESRFADPLKVDFTRNASGHAAFSRGVHTCVGSMLARTELRIFMEEWLARIPEFRIEPGFELQISSGTVSGIRKLPLEWEVR